MAKYIVCILATSQSIRSLKEVVKVLQVDKRNIRRVVEKRQLQGSFGVIFWTFHQHVNKSNILSKLTIFLITS
jgi:hypothetical protein